MTIEDVKQPSPELASLAIDWRSLEQELGKLGIKIGDLHSKGHLIGETTIQDLERRYEQISGRLLEVKEKTYDQLLETSDDGKVDDRREAGLRPAIDGAVESAKQKAGEISETISGAATSANAAVRARIASLDQKTQPHRDSVKEAVDDVAKRAEGAAHDAGGEVVSAWNTLKRDIGTVYERLRSSGDNEVLRVNRDAAKTDPEREFGSPDEIAELVSLTRAEKLTALRRWSFDVQSRLDAASEGMAPETSGVLSADAELLRQIEIQTKTLEDADCSRAARN